MSLPSPRNVLTLEGPIDLHVSAKVAESIAKLVKEKPARLVVDLSRVNYVDSSGLAVLIKRTGDMEGYGGMFFFARGGGEGRRVLYIARLGEFFFIFLWY